MALLSGPEEMDILRKMHCKAKYLTGKKCDFWRTEPDAVQGGECAAVRALQAGANAATRRFWKPKTHFFLSEYLV
jgi:hypothetical protein